MFVGSSRESPFETFVLGLAEKAWKLGYPGDRVAANFMCEQFARKARASLQRVEDAAKNLHEATRRVGTTRRACEANPRDAKRSDARDEAWGRKVVAGTNLAKALRESDMAWHQLHLVLKEWGPMAGPVRQVIQAQDDLTEFERVCLDDVIEGEAAFRAEMARYEIPPMPVRPDPPKPEQYGPYRVLRRTDGVWIVIDERRAVADRTVAEVGLRMVEANEHAKRLFDRESEGLTNE